MLHILSMLELKVGNELVLRRTTPNEMQKPLRTSKRRLVAAVFIGMDFLSFVFFNGCWLFGQALLAHEDEMPVV